MTETHNGHRCGTGNKPMTSDDDDDDTSSGVSRGSHLNDLPTLLLYRFVNDLNASVPSKSSSKMEKDDGINKEIGVAFTALENMIHIATITTPSLALTSSSSVLSTPTKTREQIQSETAKFMSHPITRRTSPLKGNLNEQEQRQQQQQQTILLGEASRQMLDGCIDSMDKLVDARLRAYCNILQQHHSNRSTCNSETNDDDPTSTGSQSSDQNANTTNTTITANNKNSVLDFKLRALLELGTNISFESFQLSIQPASRSNSSSPFEAQTSSTTVKERMASTTSTTTTTTTVGLPITVEIRMDGTSIGGLEPSHHHLATKKRKYRQPEEKEDQQDDDTADSETAGKDPSIIRITVPGIAIFNPRQSQEKHQKEEEELLSSGTETDRQKDEDADLAVDVVPNNIAYEHRDNANDDSVLASRHHHSSPSVAVVSVSNKPVSSAHQYHTHRLQGDSERESNKGGDEHKEEEHHQLLHGQNNDSAKAGKTTQSSLSSETSPKSESNSAGNKTTSCAVDFSIQVDTEKLLSAMMEEAEKLVGFVVETTNTAWRNMQTLQHPDEQQREDITNSDDNKDELTMNHDSSSSSLLSSASPKLGAKTVSEASFVPLNMSIEERKKEAEKDFESTNIGYHHRPVHLMAAPSAGLKGPSWSTDAASSSLSEPAVARSSSPFVASGSERSIHDEENHSPIDPAAAERASNIVDFIFGEIDFVENPTLPLLSTTTAPAASAGSGMNDCGGRNQSTRSKLPVSKSFRLSPMRKKLKRSDDHCVPSSLFLSSFPRGQSSPRNAATASVATDAHFQHLKEKDAALPTQFELNGQSSKQCQTS